MKVFEGCSNSLGSCSFCRQWKSGVHSVVQVEGEGVSVRICDDCFKEINLFFKSKNKEELHRKLKLKEKLLANSTCIS